MVIITYIDWALLKYSSIVGDQYSFGFGMFFLSEAPAHSKFLNHVYFIYSEIRLMER